MNITRQFEFKSYLTN